MGVEENFTVNKKTYTALAFQRKVLSSNIRQTVTTATTLDSQGVSTSTRTDTTHTIWILRADNNCEEKFNIGHEVNVREGNEVIFFGIRNNKKKGNLFNIVQMYNFATQKLEDISDFDKWVEKNYPWRINCILGFTGILTFICFIALFFTFNGLKLTKLGPFAITLGIGAVLASIFYYVYKKFKTAFFRRYFNFVNKILATYGINHNFYCKKYH